jgi:hypothetical protein
MIFSEKMSFSDFSGKIFYLLLYAREKISLTSVDFFVSMETKFYLNANFSNHFSGCV